MKCAIVNVSIDAREQRYQKLLGRLILSLQKAGEPTPVLGWVNSYPPSSPRMDEIVYAFKPFAFQWAIERGYDAALWLDSAMIAIRPLSDLWSHIGTHGHYFQANDFMMGRWCSDAALGTLGIGRDESFTIPELSTCAIGFDLRREDNQRFISDWAALAVDGVTFPGGHANDIALERIKERRWPYRTVSHVSDDPRVFGHRHDQTAASGLAWKYGWSGTLIQRPRFVGYFGQQADWGPETLLLNDGQQRASLDGCRSGG